jgi:hypothetical protein
MMDGKDEAGACKATLKIFEFALPTETFWYYDAR